MTSRFDFVHSLLAVLALSAAACGGSQPAADSPADTGGLVGNPAPDFHVKTVTGSKGTVSLQELRGQVVLLDFWGTFCEPCKKSFPKLEELEPQIRRRAACTSSESARTRTRTRARSPASPRPTARSSRSRGTATRRSPGNTSRRRCRRRSSSTRTGSCGSRTSASTTARSRDRERGPRSPRALMWVQGRSPCRTPSAELIRHAGNRKEIA